MKWSIRRPIVWAVGITLIGLIIFIVSKGSSEADSFNLDQQPSLGKASAPVEIIEFGDYKCPACKEFNGSFLSQIQEELIATGKVTFYYVHYPVIHEDSKRAARFSEVVYQVLGNDVFWQFHHVMFDEQPKNSKAVKQDIYTDEFLEKTLNGLVSEEKTEEVMKAFQDGSGRNAVDEDLRYAEELNVSETPTLFVDGEQFKGENLADLKEMVEESSHE
ncbi:DsbA family protein [Alkalihalobacillus sp. R86527]|uniref:DsbA family protein n=1 Tax=Alkalihalobacillus sp. R86527 TaxID=3093863 RepID=UPI00366ECC62